MGLGVFLKRHHLDNISPNFLGEFAHRTTLPDRFRHFAARFCFVSTLLLPIAVPVETVYANLRPTTMRLLFLVGAILPLASSLASSLARPADDLRRIRDRAANNPKMCSTGPSQCWYKISGSEIGGKPVPADKSPDVCIQSDQDVCKSEVWRARSASIQQSTKYDKWTLSSPDKTGRCLQKDVKCITPVEALVTKDANRKYDDGMDAAGCISSENPTLKEQVAKGPEPARPKPVNGNPQIKPPFSNGGKGSTCPAGRNADCALSCHSRKCPNGKSPINYLAVQTGGTCKCSCIYDGKAK